jgi:hypothetical protein
MGVETDPKEKTGQSPIINQNPEILVSPQNTDNKLHDSSEDKKTSKFASLAPKTILAKIRNMNKSAKLALILGGVLLLVGVTAFSLTRGDQQVEEQQAAIQEVEEVDSINASVSLQEGTLEIKNNEEWVAVTKDTEIKHGDVLRTVGATSRSVITFEGGSELRIDANSEVELQTITASRILIKHIAGYTYSRVVASETQTYVVVSEDAQYEAMGTAFRTSATGDEQSVEVFESSVIETGINKTAKQGEKLIVKSEANPSKNGSVEKLDIEQVKEDAFLQWNRELDLKNETFKKSLGFLNDIESPEITVNRADGETVLLEPSATEGTIEFSGTTEKGAKVTVQSKSQSGSTVIEATVDVNGGFITPVITAPVGSATFEFIATDRSGNKTTKNLRITFQRKSQSITGSGINLSGKLDSDGKKVNLNWALTGSTTAPDGYKVVYSESKDPTFTKPETVGVTSKQENTTSTSTTISGLSKGKRYYFKICLYDASTSTCGLYSNQVEINID